VLSKSGNIKSKINIDGHEIHSTDGMWVLGIDFDSKLNWSNHINKIIRTSAGACQGLRHIRKFFTQDEMLKIATSTIYTKFYYGAQVWLGPMLIKGLKKRLLAASSWIIRAALGLDDWLISYKDLHEIAGRGTPDQMQDYFHSIAFYDIFNYQLPEQLWVELNDRSSMNDRTRRVNIMSTNKTRIGLNSLLNRLNKTTREIDANHLNLSKPTYKARMKQIFITDCSS